MSLRVAFMGTPDFAVPTLAAIAVAGHAVVAAYSRPPAASGRGLRSRRSPVHEAAERLGVPVRTPATLRDESEVAALRDLAADVAVVVAYGLLLPPPILAAPAQGCLNLHASLLPRWRGAAPIHRAVMAGDDATGVCVMRMEAGLDTGPVARVARVPIGPDATTGELHDSLAALGAELAIGALADLEAGALRFEAQPDDGVTYARKIANDEARIVWDAPAQTVHDLVRGLSPWPGAFFEADLGRGSERVKVLRSARAYGSGPPGALLGEGLVACADGALRLLTVQRAGRAPVEAAEFWRGIRLEPGAVLAA